MLKQMYIFTHKTTYTEKDMDTQTFISKYRQAFGETAELPLLFYYDNEPVADTEKINGCFFKGMDAARKGEGLSLSAETIGCGGGKLYTAFAPMPEHVPGFVSQKERYKASPEDVITCIERLDIRPAAKKYLNFIRIDRVESFEPMEGILNPWKGFCFLPVPTCCQGWLPGHSSTIMPMMRSPAFSAQAVHQL